MKLVFMGSGAFAVPSLQALLDSRHEVLALVTQPDKPAGRGHALRMPETKPLALARGIEVHQPARVRSEEAVTMIGSIRPECIVVVAYGQIIPKTILEIPPKGIINVHGSLLPRYRGAAPVQWAIARGETETGVSTMLMDEGLDTGPVLQQAAIAIAEDDTGGSLEAKLSSLGANLLLDTLSRWERGEIVPTPQDDARATLAPRIKKEDGRIDWSRPAEEIERRVRAFDPWPVAFFEVGGAPIRVFQARLGEEEGDSGEAPPGRILAAPRGRGIAVACGGRRPLVIEELQAPGKTRMNAADFARGQRWRAGDSLAS